MVPRDSCTVYSGCIVHAGMRIYQLALGRFTSVHLILDIKEMICCIEINKRELFFAFTEKILLADGYLDVQMWKRVAV